MAQTQRSQASDEGSVERMCQAALILPVLERVGDRVDAADQATLQQLKSALCAADAQFPAFLWQLVKSMVDISGLHRIKLQESFLLLQASAPNADLELPPRLLAISPVYGELSTRALQLRRVLARVPDEMADRRAFLETIKEIASAIKKLLDATNAVHAQVPASVQPSVERRKKEFVHYSKRFSNTLKDYFKGQDADAVFVSANQLIFQTTHILRTVRQRMHYATAE